VVTLDFSQRPLIEASELLVHQEQFDDLGYSLVKNFLTEDECRVLKASMLKATENYEPIEGVERSFLDRYQMHDLINQDLNYARLLEDPRLDQLIAPHLGPSWIMYATTSSAVPPHGTNYANRIHVDAPRFSSDFTFNVGVLWVLDDYTLDNGAVRVLAGSHRSAAAPSEEYFDQHAQPVVCERGSLIFLHPRIWHRAGANTTDHWRCSMTMNACRSFMKQRMDWVRFLRPEIVTELNEQGRRLIGFDTRLATTMEEFFLPEDQRLYKANQG
jgi:ectoine hydroxylase-related dioxygenase (phytanoyl-CoA dioxygenase family)